MKFQVRMGITLICLMLLGLTLVAACGDDDDDGATPTLTPTQTPTETPTQTPTETPSPTAQPSPTPTEEITVTIGNLTDITGPAAFAMTVVNAALDDIVRYANEENLIPGVELKVENYDTEYNPSRDIPGYEFVKQAGADLILAGLPNTPITLESRVNDDEMVMIAMGSAEEAMDPPGYGFCLNSSTANKTKTLLKWVAENDWDYANEGPAKIGIVAWNTSYFTEQEVGAKEYVEAHPDQFEWGGSYFTEMVFTFGAEVSATKDFDYLLPPGAPLTQFVEQYREAGGTAKLLMTDSHHTNLGRISDAGNWGLIDGSYFQIPCRWWNEDASVTNLARQLLLEHRGEGKLNEYMRDGGAYIGAFHQLYSLIDMVRTTVENVGVENFSTQALYDTLQGMTFDYGPDYAPWSFSETDRFGYDYEGMYLADGDAENLIRADEDWIPVVK